MASPKHQEICTSLACCLDATGFFYLQTCRPRVNISSYRCIAPFRIAECLATPRNVDSYFQKLDSLDHKGNNQGLFTLLSQLTKSSGRCSMARWPVIPALVVLVLCVQDLSAQVSDPITPLYKYDATDASTLNTTTVGNTITSWMDAQGTASNGRDWAAIGGHTTYANTGSVLYSLPNAVRFDGGQVDGDIMTGTFGNSDFTNGNGGRQASFEIWLRPDAFSDQLIFETGGGTNGLGIMMNADGTVKFVAKQGGNQPDVTSTATLSTSELSQIVGVVEDNTGNIRLYVNGVDQGVSVDPSADWTTGTDAAGLGIDENALPSELTTNPFAGDIALFRIFDDELSQADVQLLFNDLAAPVP